MAEKANILQLVSNGDADAADQVRILVEGLDRRRYQPLVAGELTPQMRERLSRQDTPWVYLEIPRSFSPQAYLIAAGQLRRLIQARDIALIHCHNMEATAVAVLASRWLGRSSSLPVVSTLHAPSADAIDRIYGGWGEASRHSVAAEPLRWANRPLPARPRTTGQSGPPHQALYSHDLPQPGTLAQ